MFDRLSLVRVLSCCQLLAQSQSKASSKKRKRLDKYIVRTFIPYYIDTQKIYTLLSGEKAKEGRARRAV